jgi:hypothetical protein
MAATATGIIHEPHRNHYARDNASYSSADTEDQTSVRRATRRQRPEQFALPSDLHTMTFDHKLNHYWPGRSSRSAAVGVGLVLLQPCHAVPDRRITCIQAFLMSAICHGLKQLRLSLLMTVCYVRRSCTCCAYSGLIAVDGRKNTSSPCSDIKVWQQTDQQKVVTSHFTNERCNIWTCNATPKVRNASTMVSWNCTTRVELGLTLREAAGARNSSLRPVAMPWPCIEYFNTPALAVAAVQWNTQLRLIKNPTCSSCKPA